jgi:hypothetical protein
MEKLFALGDKLFKVEHIIDIFFKVINWRHEGIYEKLSVILRILRLLYLLQHPLILPQHLERMIMVVV